METSDTIADECRKSGVTFSSLKYKARIVFARVLIAFSAMLLLTNCEDTGAEPDPELEIIEVSGVSLNKTELPLAIGDSESLSATVTPSNATNRNVTWSSNSATVATVDANGKVTAVKIGTAVITVTTQDGGETATCSVSVTAAKVAVTRVTLDVTELTVSVDEQKTFVASITPPNATNKKVTWSSSNQVVATVNANGKMTAVKVGNTTITVTTEDGTKTANCKVTVEAVDPNNLLNAIYIPDPVFLDYCRKNLEKWDKNKDGKLYADEAAAVTTIDVANIYGNAIYSLKGIEYFTGIDYLDCSLNNLTSLDVSACTRLSDLYCNNNKRLASLTISGYTTLTFLNCSGCMLTELDVTKCTRLFDLSCFSNDLTSLDVSKCTNLNYLDVDGNELTSLDLTKNRALKGLICSNNQITSLDLSACTALTSLECDNNDLTSLDISKNKALIILNCDMNQLTSLDITGNDAIESLLCNTNQLTSIEINENNTSLNRIISSNNRLSSGALNTVFEALPFSGSIVIHNNPGTSTCDVSIAAKKNWTVEPN